MSSDPNAEDEPQVIPPPHAVEADEPPFPLDGGRAGDGDAGETVDKLGEEAIALPGPGDDPVEGRPSPDPPPPAVEHPLPHRGGGGGEPPAEPVPELAKPKRHLRWGRALLVVLAVLILWPPISVLALKVIPPPVTILMLERLVQGRGLDKAWRSLDRIAPSLPLAVIAAEDAKFCEHDGFDWDAIRIAAEHNARSPTKVRGGSTLSQQTAKNVFLWPSRDYVRKGLEAGYTVLIEKLWGKRRILETYLNVVEWGPGLYGAQAAAQRYFHEDASRLSPEQSARLAAILPSPLKWKAVNPGRYVARRSRKIGANAQLVRTDDLAWCVKR